MAKFSFPHRTIHLDFHTGPDIPNVASDFNAKKFAKTFQDAHVDSVTVFATCHHGHAYYKTNHPCRHPGLPAGLDLTGRQIKVLKSSGIRAPIYLSCQVNEYAANIHPDWVAIEPDGVRSKKLPREHSQEEGPALNAGWQVLDMSSPYQDYLAEQLTEVLELYHPVDGIFLDMCWDQPSISPWALRGMTKKNLDPRKSEDRNKYARQVALDYMKRFSDMVEHAGKRIDHFGIWFNSRPKTNLHNEKKFLRRVEIESLPTGGWGYSYFPYVARYTRPLGLKTLSHTGRFFRGWGDNASLKPLMALKYECCQILSQGMTGGVGDLLHPSGVPQKAVYDLIGTVYSHIKKCEPFVLGGKVQSQIALVIDPDLGDEPGVSELGATRALQQLQQQFDVISPKEILGKYELVIIAETTPIDQYFVKSLEKYLSDGGRLILCGESAIDNSGHPLLAEQGILNCGDSPFSQIFLRLGSTVRGSIPKYDHVTYESGFRMKPELNAESLVRVVEPYFERHFQRFSGHSYTPPSKISKYSAVVKNKGVITFSFPILACYARYASPILRQLLGNCIDLLIEKPLIRVSNAPTLLETTVVKKGDSTIVHLLSFAKERRVDTFDHQKGEMMGIDIIEDVVPVVNKEIKIFSKKSPKRVSLQPDNIELPFTCHNEYVQVNIDLHNGHGMIVID